MTKGINELSREKLFVPGRTSISLCLYYLLVCSISGFLFYAITHNLVEQNFGLFVLSGSVGAILWWGWFYMLVSVVVKAGTALSSLHAKYGIDERIPSDMVTFLTLAALLSLPYLQGKLNGIIDRAREANLT